MWKKLVQSTSLYSHCIMRINALQGELVWAKIQDKIDEFLFNTVEVGAFTELCYFCMNKWEHRFTLLLNCL